MTRRSAVAGVLLAIALTACGNGDGGSSGVASLGDGAGAGAPSAPAGPKDRDEAMLDFAKCMRENGFDMPDPQPGGPVLIGPGMGGRQPTEADARKFDEARRSCQQHLEGIGAGPGGGQAGPPPEIQEKLLAMARCMRENGYDVPDPEFENGGRIRAELPDGVDPADPKFQQAQQSCRDEAGLTGFGGPR